MLENSYRLLILENQLQSYLDATKRAGYVLDTKKGIIPLYASPKSVKIIFNETSQVFKTRIPKSRRAELERVLEPLFNRVPLTGKYATYDKIIEADGESTLGCFMLRKKRREGGTVLLAYSCAHHKGSWLRHGEEEVKENPREYVVETEPNDAEIEPEIITLNGRRITVSQQS